MDEYRKYIEKDAALERRFQPIIVPEATVEETIAVLYGIRQGYEQHHKVEISDEAVVQAAKLAKRYIADRFLPDKAIDLIDEAASLARIKKGGNGKVSRGLQKQLADIYADIEEAVENQDFELAARLKTKASIMEQKVTAQRLREGAGSEPIVIGSEDIAEVISMITGVPLTRLIKTETESLVKLDEALSKRVIGQTEAVSVVSRAIRRSRTGISDTRRPIGSFIFLGPTGVGKTELARQLAEEMFHDRDALVKIDMSEFMEKHNVSRLVGAPAGYIGYDDGGQLTEIVRRKPYSLILFDEIEKAHPDVFNMLLQILEDGFVSDAKGRKVDFRNTIIIMTSNVGASDMYREAKMGFKAETRDDEREVDVVHEQIKTKVMSDLKQTFRPEFLNRIDQVVVFRSLSKADIKRILNLQLADLSARLTEQQIDLKVTSSAKSFLMEKGYDLDNGARPMRRAIQDYIEDPLAGELLSLRVKSGDTVEVTRRGDKLHLETVSLAHTTVE